MPRDVLAASAACVHFGRVKGSNSDRLPPNATRNPELKPMSPEAARRLMAKLDEWSKEQEDEGSWELVKKTINEHRHPSRWVD